MSKLKFSPPCFISKIFAPVAAALVLVLFSGEALAADPVAQSGISAKSGVWPVMVRMDYNPVMQIVVNVCEKQVNLQELKLDFSKTTNPNDIEGADVYIGGDLVKPGEKFVTTRPSKSSPIVTAKGLGKLGVGENSIWISVRMKKKADISGKISVVATNLKIAGMNKQFTVSSKPTEQRIGYTVAKKGDLGSKNYRIPALARNPKTGTLIAVYDIRYNHGGDLPANIDVGVSRSADGGNTWTDPEVAITYKGLGYGNGIGDSGILVDNKTGDVWVAALMAGRSGKNPIWDAATTDPDACGQLMVSCSKNDGKTWSKPRNITADVKRNGEPTWGTVFQGPGAGICTKDGTLIFPAQIWNGGSHGGVLVYSKDGGKTWTSSSRMTWGGSESTCVQLKDGSIMLNVRQGSPSSRVVATTKDLGATWKKFEGENLRQPGNLCQAALLTDNGKELYFSNPNSGRRDNMTIRYSKDGGKTWSGGLIYDDRKCAGYSTTAFADKDNKTIGVLYEGTPDAQVLFYLRIPVDEIKKAK